MPDAPASTVPVLLPLPLAGPLDYRADADIPPGSFVAVGLGPRRVIGVVWDGAAGEVPAERLKPVIEVLPTPPLPAGPSELRVTFSLQPLGGAVGGGGIGGVPPGGLPSLTGAQGPETYVAARQPGQPLVFTVKLP